MALTRSTSAEDAALAALLAEETGDGLVSPQPAGSPQPPAVHTWRWVFSAMAVVALGWSSAVSGAQVPLLSGVDFGVHELGHLLTAWAPWVVTAAAGSVLQVAVPLGLAAYFGFARHEIWAAAPLMAWAGTSARNVAVYIADAPYQRLELWGGDGVLHDWAQLLAGRPMQHAEQIAWVVNAIGWLLIAGGLGLVAWMAVAERLAAARFAAKRAADEARHATLPVREPRGPIG